MLLTGIRSVALLTAVLAIGCSDDEPDQGMDMKGPGAALRCDSSGKNAWDTYGVEAFVAVNEAIFREVNEEVTANGAANLGGSFGGVTNLAGFKGNLAAFLVWAYGGPSEITYTDGQKYIGPQNMVAVHAGLAITAAQYDYFIANVVVPALTSSGVPAGTGGSTSPNDVASCFAPIVTDAAFKASIVGK
jgi:hypothetical protein